MRGVVFPQPVREESVRGGRDRPGSEERHPKMDTPLSVQSVVAVAREQVSCPLGDEAAILNLKNSVYYGANAAGTRVWNLLQEPKSVLQLRDALLEEYDVETERCERDLLEFLEKMRAEGLIEIRAATAEG